MANESNNEQLQAAIKGLRVALTAQPLTVPGVTFVEKAELSLVLDRIDQLQERSEASAETNHASEWKCRGSLVYRLTVNGTKRDLIYVEMACGSYRKNVALADRAQQLCALLNAAG